jgi:hypothetical protein
MHAILAEQQERARERVPYPAPTNLSFEDLQALGPDKVPAQERVDAFRKFAEWYDHLTEISNIVFTIEYVRRQRTS